MYAYEILLCDKYIKNTKKKKEKKNIPFALSFQSGIMDDKKSKSKKKKNFFFFSKLCRG